MRNRAFLGPFAALALLCCAPADGQVSSSLSSGQTAAQVNAAVAAEAARAQAAEAAIPNAAAMAAAAPVQSVNTKTGAITIPAVCRQQSASLALPTTNPASVTFTFPNTSCSFAAAPSCWTDISTTTSGWAFDQALNTARSTAAVTYSFTAHATTLTIALGTLSLSVGPPAGSSGVLTCTGTPA